MVDARLLEFLTAELTTLFYIKLHHLWYACNAIRIGDCYVFGFHFSIGSEVTQVTLADSSGYHGNRGGIVTVGDQQQQQQQFELVQPYPGETYGPCAGLTQQMSTLTIQTGGTPGETFGASPAFHTPAGVSRPPVIILLFSYICFEACYMDCKDLCNGAIC